MHTREISRRESLMHGRAAVVGLRCCMPPGWRRRSRAGRARKSSPGWISRHHPVLELKISNRGKTSRPG